ncbi:unnamed protein product [Vitrella brassicaformis CCMP3155]|uniref:Uncharacterized protein n=2 Tax=Vitrella brassicaformis TaxID=1169539 RepID=A0A0G4H0V1_VITBC|nr:unnamed protein product [Vitrella brassicaformis CCMP3155]|eukprot:CEM37200.1 unnamed protein product [Vitrella brassicaformis CCMP3155]
MLKRAALREDSLRCIALVSPPPFHSVRLARRNKVLFHEFRKPPPVGMKFRERRVASVTENLMDHPLENLAGEDLAEYAYRLHRTKEAGSDEWEGLVVRMTELVNTPLLKANHIAQLLKFLAREKEKLTDDSLAPLYVALGERLPSFGAQPAARAFIALSGLADLPETGHPPSESPSGSVWRLVDTLLERLEDHYVRLKLSPRAAALYACGCARLGLPRSPHKQHSQALTVLRDLLLCPKAKRLARMEPSELQDVVWCYALVVPPDRALFDHIVWKIKGSEHRLPPHVCIHLVIGLRRVGRLREALPALTTHLSTVQSFEWCSATDLARALHALIPTPAVSVSLLCRVARAFDGEGHSAEALGWDRWLHLLLRAVKKGLATVTRASAEQVLPEDLSSFADKVDVVNELLNALASETVSFDAATDEDSEAQRKIELGQLLLKHLSTSWRASREGENEPEETLAYRNGSVRASETQAPAASAREGEAMIRMQPSEEDPDDDPWAGALGRLLQRKAREQRLAIQSVDESGGDECVGEGEGLAKYERKGRVEAYEVVFGPEEADRQE